MMGWFRRKRKQPIAPAVTEWKKHQEALRYFLRNKTSMGCYGTSEDLERARDAMRFFRDLAAPGSIHHESVYERLREEQNRG
jgi:hypothetical protein